MDNYIKYAFYDDVGKYIAIINQNTPKEIIQELRKQYDEVRFKEEY